jgi:hypothetical protein
LNHGHATSGGRWDGSSSVASIGVREQASLTAINA